MYVPKVEQLITVDTVKSVISTCQEYESDIGIGREKNWRNSEKKRNYIDRIEGR